MRESDRAKREPYLLPPSESELWLKERQEERRMRQKRYYAKKRLLKRSLEVLYAKA